jgi:hypothetical protein
MGDCLLLVGVGAVVFASTNVDDIFVLLGFFPDPRFRVRQVAWASTSGSPLSLPPASSSRWLPR